MGTSPVEPLKYYSKESLVSLSAWSDGVPTSCKDTLIKHDILKRDCIRLVSPLEVLPGIMLPVLTAVQQGQMQFLFANWWEKKNDFIASTETCLTSAALPRLDKLVPLGFKDISEERPL